MGYQIEIYQTSAGKKPFGLWFEKLKDINAKTLILERLDRIKLGNLGDAAPVGGGLTNCGFTAVQGIGCIMPKVAHKLLCFCVEGPKALNQKT